MGEFRSAYDLRNSRSKEERVVIRLPDRYVDNFCEGKREEVDLSKLSTGDHCPEIEDMSGCALLKRCRRTGGSCGPRAYINHWRECPWR